MVVTPTSVLIGLKLVTLALGFFLVYLGVGAYVRKRQRTVFWMSVGLLILTLGVVAEYAAFAGLGLSLDQAHIVEAVVGVIGFAVLVYSLYVRG